LLRVDTSLLLFPICVPSFAGISQPSFAIFVASFPAEKSKSFLELSFGVSIFAPNCFLSSVKMSSIASIYLLFASSSLASEALIES
jgi:hypothetical protein